MALVTPADVSKWIKRDIAQDAQPDLEECIKFAQMWIATYADLRSLEVESSPQTIVVDGVDAINGGTDLWFPNYVRPAWNSGSNLISVKENGVTLTVGQGYDPTKDVIVVNPNPIRPAMLYRLGLWQPLRQNVEITCIVGYDGDPAATYLALPEDVKRLVIEVSWLMFNAYQWVGKSSENLGGARNQNVTFTNDLSTASKETLDALRGW